jgi:hypothetical protein
MAACEPVFCFLQLLDSAATTRRPLAQTMVDRYHHIMLRLLLVHVSPPRVRRRVIVPALRARSDRPPAGTLSIAPVGRRPKRDQRWLRGGPEEAKRIDWLVHSLTDDDDLTSGPVCPLGGATVSSLSRRTATRHSAPDALLCFRLAVLRRDADASRGSRRNILDTSQAEATVHRTQRANSAREPAARTHSTSRDSR